MIRPLRQRHRIAISAIAILLPIAFVAGIAARKTIPAMELPPAIIQPQPAFSHLVFKKDNLWPDLEVAVRVFADSLPPANLIVELQPRSYIKMPDILIYWSPRPANSLEKLPENAFLVGTLSGVEARRFPLPSPALNSDGSLILYSLARQEMIAAALAPIHKGLKKGGAQ